MKSHICYTALGLALAAATSAAHAQTVIEQAVPPSGILVTPPVQPVQTVATVPVETVETVRTVRRVGTTARHRTTHHIARNQPANVVTTTRRTVRRARILPEEATIAAAPPYAPVAPVAPVAAVATYPQPLYDVVVPAEPTVPPPMVEQPVIGTAVASAPVALPAYRYVYEPDRILVIDANTGIAVQAIPR